MKSIPNQDSSDEELELSQALPITDSDDESVQYLKSVRSQAANYKQRYMESHSSPQPPPIPQPLIPSTFSLNLSASQKDSILSEFTKFRESLAVWLSIKAEESSTRSFGTKEEWYDFIITQSNPPYLEYICRFDQLTFYKLIRWHSDWLNSYELTEHLSSWIYSLLAGVQKPLLMETMGDMNSILSKFIEVSDKDYAKILILIISEYFGQKIGI
jgi:hypothetical protein